MGNNTHPGIDIVADCGSPIYAFADGRVTDLIKDEKDRNFDSLGYMIIIKHLEPINGKDTYSTYLHMAEPPAVSKGQTVKAGDVLGKVGDTGKTDGCHVHFELRHFPDRFLNDKGWNYPLNIYGKGDQRSEKRFLDNWEDPEAYFRKYPGGMVSRGDKPSKPETKEIVKGEQIEDYFPIQNGASWEYKVKVRFETIPTERDDKATVECRGRVSFKNQEAILFVWSFSSYQEKEYFQLTKQGLFNLGYEYTNKPQTSYEPPLVKLLQPIKPNHTWNDGPGNIVTIEGKEETHVPAGRFEAIKVVKRFRITPAEVIEWYAKGTGLVRQVVSTPDTGYTKTCELVSYSAVPTFVARVQEEYIGVNKQGQGESTEAGGMVSRGEKPQPKAKEVAKGERIGVQTLPTEKETPSFVEYDAKSWRDKGFALHRKGRYKEAITCYDKALEINPENAYTRSKKAAVEAATFIKKYKIKRVADPEELLSNPFVYKGERIAIWLEFVMMTAENEALFWGKLKETEEALQLSIPFMVSGVPSTTFTRGKFTLAVSILGLTKPKGVDVTVLGTGVKSDTAPHLQYLGHEQGDLTKYIAEALEKK